MTTARGIVQLRVRTNAPRHEAIPAITEAMTESGILLEDFQEFSNTMITYRFEIDQAEVPVLRERLVAADFVLEDVPEDDRDDEAVSPDDDGFVRATLQLTFPNEDGDRRNPNPDLG
ncbi:MAG: hypothetical protein AAF799_13665 [Myxococcota bacterium]